MPVLYYFEQYGPFLGIKRYKEEVVKDEQLATLDLPQLRLKRALDLGDFQCTEQLGGHWHRMSGTPFCMPHVQGRRLDSFSPYRKSR